MYVLVHSVKSVINLNTKFNQILTFLSLTNKDFNLLNSPSLKHKLLPPLILTPAIDEQNSTKRQNYLNEKRSQSHQQISSHGQFNQLLLHNQHAMRQQQAQANLKIPYVQQPGSRFQVKRFIFPSVNNSDDSDESAKTHPGYSIA